MTTHQAVRRFLAAINGRPVPASPALTTSAAEKAGRELDARLKRCAGNEAA
jgi:hypothetical protein